MDGYGQCLLCRWFSCRWRRGACSHFSNHGGWSITEASLGWNYRSLINLHPHPEKTSPIPWITLCNILYQYLGSNHGCHLSVGLQGSSSDESRTNTKHQRGLFHKINTPWIGVITPIKWQSYDIPWDLKTSTIQRAPSMAWVIPRLAAARCTGWHALQSSVDVSSHLGIPKKCLVPWESKQLSRWTPKGPKFSC